MLATDVGGGYLNIFSLAYHSSFLFFLPLSGGELGI